MSTPTRSRLDLWGHLAFGALVLIVYSEFLHARHIDGTEGQVAATFLLGAAYSLLGIFNFSKLSDDRRLLRALYFPIQCSLATAILFVTPLKGFSAIIVMPVVSMAVLDLSWGWATLIVLELYAACIAAVGMTYGLGAVPSSVTNYGIAVLFTVVFSIATRGALSARARAENLSAELAAANEQLRRYAAQAEELATTRERNRLAREIHDGLGHYLTTINVQLEAARAVLAHQPAQAATALEHAVRLSREALADVRQSVGSLRVDATRPPLPVAIEAAATNLGLSVTVRVEGTSRPLPPAVEHAFFRAAQEGLTNVHRHAAAAPATVTLDFRGLDRVALVVADEGRSPAAPTPGGGFGLRGIRERVELLGGSVSAGPRTEGGFLLRIEVPA